MQDPFAQAHFFTEFERFDRHVDNLRRKGERIVFIRTLVAGKQGTEAGRSIDTVANTGQYL